MDKFERAKYFAVRNVVWVHVRSCARMSGACCRVGGNRSVSPAQLCCNLVLFRYVFLWLILHGEKKRK